jgi:hypothetical protein
MNREHIIVMADASGLSLYGMGKDREQFIDYLECFADLVARAERKEWETEFAGMGEWACVYLLEERNK